MLVVPTLTRHDLLDRMLGSIDYPVGHLVVIDNSGTLTLDREGPWEALTVLRMPVNFGVAASWNLALRMGHRHDWVMIGSDDIEFQPDTLGRWADMSSEDTLLVSETWPHWCAFTIGMGIVQQIGMFDEGFFPAYYEDTDYERRCHRAGVELRHGPPVSHRNSSTLNTEGAGFRGSNDRSFRENGILFAEDRYHGFDPFRWRNQAWT